MIEPTTVSEKLLFSTLRLETKHGIGTGFYFLLELDKNKTALGIITNKHVINNNPKEKVYFSFHYNENGCPSEEVINVDYSTEWIFHNDYDLAFTFINPLFEFILKKTKKEPYFIYLTENHIWNNQQLKRLSSVENVLMFGYPIGLYDKKNILPLVRMGITSSHPAINFNGEKIGVVDIACFPGSSGSPIFILDEGSYTDKKNHSFIVGNRFIFLGILYSGPAYNSKGEIIIEKIPTQQRIKTITPLMINLGYYIKSEAILDFKEIIKNHFN